MSLYVYQQLVYQLLVDQQLVDQQLVDQLLVGWVGFKTFERCDPQLTPIPSPKSKVRAPNPPTHPPFARLQN